MAKKEIPVYIFTGFLDSGKTSFIKETLKENQFKDGLESLYICCEEGECELTEKEIAENKFVVKVIEDEDDVTEEKLCGFDSEVVPDRVVIETNGMWDIQEMFDALPDNWQITEIITTVDSTTFEMYLSNMKMMITNQFKYSDLIMFNRCLENHDRAMFKRMVRAVNRRGQVLYETLDGKVEDNVPEELPYDVNKDEISIGDDDYGIFYIDLFDNGEVYNDKKVVFKASLEKKRTKFGKEVLVAGRKAMTCCTEDIAFVGLPCECGSTELRIAKDGWYYVKGKIKFSRKRFSDELLPYIVLEGISDADAPAEEIVTF